jgi:hypothetical protein
METKTKNCVKKAQLFRLPMRHKTGIFTLSISGDHNHLKEYGIFTNEKAPIATSVKPDSFNHKLSVEKTSKKGKPLAKPNALIDNIERLAYTFVIFFSFLIILII